MWGREWSGGAVSHVLELGDPVQNAIANTPNRRSPRTGRIAVRNPPRRAGLTILKVHESRRRHCAGREEVEVLRWRHIAILGAILLALLHHQVGTHWSAVHIKGHAEIMLTLHAVKTLGLKALKVGRPVGGHNIVLVTCQVRECLLGARACYALLLRFSQHML